MARFAGVVAVCSALSVAPAVAAARPGPPGRPSPARPAPKPPAPCTDGLSTVAVPVPPGVHVADNRVDVYLPPAYCAPSDLHDDFPVLYLLHGVGDTYAAWSTNTDLVSFARSYDVIIVMPDGGHGTDAGWYSNWLDGQFQYETYDIDVLPRYIDSHYRSEPDDLAVAGNSMGGFGALSYAARHPRMFRAAASFSGAVDMLYGAPASGVVFAELNSEYGTPDSRVWGSQVTDRSVWAAHNPASLAGDLRHTAVFLASGTGTPGGAEGDDPADAGDYALENGIFQMNLSLVRALDLAGVAHTDDFYPGGYHGWPYWQADLHWALPQLAQILGPPVAQPRPGPA